MSLKCSPFWVYDSSEYIPFNRWCCKTQLKRHTVKFLRIFSIKKISRVLNSLWQVTKNTAANKFKKLEIIKIMIIKNSNNYSVQFSSVAQSCLTLWPHESQDTRPPCPSPTPGVHPNPCRLSWWCHPDISSSVIPSPPAPNPSQHHGHFPWVNSSHEVAKVLEFQL